MCFSCALATIRSSASSMQVLSSNDWDSRSILWASILEKSRMSLIRVSNISPLVRIVSAKSRCRASSRVSSSRPVIPMMAFSGVRISWLMLARNWLLTSLALASSTFIFSNSSSARFRSVISRSEENRPTTRPCSSSSGFLMVSNHRVVPSGSVISCSVMADSPAFMIRCSSSQYTWAWSAGNRSKSVLPNKSCWVLPRMSATARLAARKTDRLSLKMMISDVVSSKVCSKSV